MRSAAKTLAFPLAGVSRKAGYREQTRPFATPWAVNVRGRGALEKRERGGSRPGLTKLVETDLGNEVTALFPITYLDGAGDLRHDLAYVADGHLGTVQSDGALAVPEPLLQTAAGDNIQTADGEDISFDGSVSAVSLGGAVRAGRVYLADSLLKNYDPNTGVVETVVATAGAVPTAQPLVCVYRDRLVLAGADHVWYASRVADPTDWDFGAAMEDPGRAVAGQLALGGKVGETVTALVPLSDQALVLATENTLWVLRGDPATGRLDQVSAEIGIIANNAWAVSPDGLLVFLSNDGVYLWPGSGHPARFSGERVPELLREVDTSTNTVSMAHDPEGRGFHLFVTPDDGLGTHWWIDAENKAMWPVVLQEDHQPLAAAVYSPADIGNVVLACRDGFLRYVDATATTDDGQGIVSHVLIGPVRLAADDVRDGMLAELHGIVDTAGTLTWRIVLGGSAQAAAEAAYAGVVAALAGGTPSGVAASGSWGDARNRVARPRARGAWLVVWLSSSSARWEFEAVPFVVRQLGRAR